MNCNRGHVMGDSDPLCRECELLDTDFGQAAEVLFDALEQQGLLKDRPILSLFPEAMLPRIALEGDGAVRELAMQVLDLLPWKSESGPEYPISIDQAGKPTMAEAPWWRPGPKDSRELSLWAGNDLAREKAVEDAEFRQVSETSGWSCYGPEAELWYPFLAMAGELGSSQARFLLHGGYAGGPPVKPSAFLSGTVEFVPPARWRGRRALQQQLADGRWMKEPGSYAEPQFKGLRARARRPDTSQWTSDFPACELKEEDVVEALYFRTDGWMATLSLSSCEPDFSVPSSLKEVTSSLVLKCHLNPRQGMQPSSQVFARKIVDAACKHIIHPMRWLSGERPLPLGVWAEKRTLNEALQAAARDIAQKMMASPHEEPQAGTSATQIEHLERAVASGVRRLLPSLMSVRAWSERDADLALFRLMVRYRIPGRGQEERMVIGSISDRMLANLRDERSATVEIVAAIVREIRADAESFGLYLPP